MKILKQIRDLCISYYKDRLLCLVVFGSVAKDSFSPLSDIDLLIIFKDKKDQYKEYADYYNNVENKLLFKKDLPVEINPIFKSFKDLKVKTPYFWNTEFLILYDRENLFKEFLNKLEKFKSKSIIIHKEPVEYIELVNEQ
ncbi:MAG: nucleotidyltransferase domain-containing protein [Thermodesulfovibrio sp.]|nr:nucleotidyltransferase domain-containing protein [Thermodesulfovibrio sp.]